jgi:hypothetical protein
MHWRRSAKIVTALDTMIKREKDESRHDEFAEHLIRIYGPG